MPSSAAISAPATAPASKPSSPSAPRPIRAPIVVPSSTASSRVRLLKCSTSTSPSAFLCAASASMTRIVSLSRSRSSSAMISPWNSGWSNPRTMSCTGPIAMVNPPGGGHTGRVSSHIPKGVSLRLCRRTSPGLDDVRRCSRSHRSRMRPGCRFAGVPPADEGGAMSTEAPEQPEVTKEPARKPPAPKVTHRTEAERYGRGRAARERAPRTSHATLDTVNRDPVAIVDADSATRVPELVPIRYGRMLVSPFTFYRGAASLMAHDLASTPRTGLNAQLCGDAHCSNFGGFASPSRDLVFDLNDFDETLPGPFEWDVKRLAASVEIAARDRGFDDKIRRASVLASVRSYRESMRSFAAMGNLAVWYTRVDVAGLLAGLDAQKQ